MKNSYNISRIGNFIYNYFYNLYAAKFVRASRIMQMRPLPNVPMQVSVPPYGSETESGIMPPPLPARSPLGYSTSAGNTPAKKRDHLQASFKGSSMNIRKNNACVDGITCVC